MSHYAVPAAGCCCASRLALQEGTAADAAFGSRLSCAGLIKDRKSISCWAVPISQILRHLHAARSLISIDGSEGGGPEVSEREAAATARTMECIRSCNVAAVFADCAYLRPDALLALARAVVWAAGGSAAADGNTDTAEVRVVPACIR